MVSFFNFPGEKDEKGKDIYAPFHGKNIVMLPRLLAVNRNPMAEDFFQRRIDVLAMYDKEAVDADPIIYAVLKAVRDEWWNTYADLAHLWVRHPDKGGKIVPYDGNNGKVMEVLRQITPQATLVDNALPLLDGFYETIDGEYVVELKPADIEKLHGKSHQHGTIHTVDSWVALTRGKDRAQKYDDAVHKVTGRDEYMAQYFGPASNGKVTARLWFVLSRSSSSVAVSNLNLGGDGGRLFSVAPKAQALQTELSDVVRTADVGRLLTEELNVPPQDVGKYLERLSAYQSKLQ